MAAGTGVSARPKRYIRSRSAVPPARCRKGGGGSLARSAPRPSTFLSVPPTRFGPFGDNNGRKTRMLVVARDRPRANGHRHHYRDDNDGRLARASRCIR